MTHSVMFVNYVLVHYCIPSPSHKTSHSQERTVCTVLMNNDVSSSLNGWHNHSPSFCPLLCTTNSLSCSVPFRDGCVGWACPFFWKIQVRLKLKKGGGRVNTLGCTPLCPTKYTHRQKHTQSLNFSKVEMLDRRCHASFKVHSSSQYPFH